MSSAESGSDPDDDLAETLAEQDHPFAKLIGETELEFRCGVAANDYFGPEDPEYCDHEAETVELDEPAYVDSSETIHLPGRPVECPECGNPAELEFNGVSVFFV